MARTENTKTSKSALLIICEGKVTEPLFFDGIKRTMRLDFDILPKPPLEDEDKECHSSRGQARRKRKHLKTPLTVNEKQEEQKFSGAPPMCWVTAGEQKLDTYEEVWCIFDKDGHPRCKEAFDEVDKLAAGGNNRLHIGFSSISIEYYFLLHFEYIFKAFPKCECNEKVGVGKKTKTVPYRCMTEEAIEGKACNGDKCVQGYARSKEYWKDTKKAGTNFYPLLAPHLLTGISNATLLRRQSIATYPALKIYERNPYVDVDKLVTMLLGYSALEIDETITVKDGTAKLNVSRTSNSMEIHNIGNVAYALQQGIASVFKKSTETYTNLNIASKIIYQGDPPAAIELSVLSSGDIIFLNFGRTKILSVI